MNQDWLVEASESRLYYCKLDSIRKEGRCRKITFPFLFSSR